MCIFSFYIFLGTKYVNVNAFFKRHFVVLERKSQTQNFNIYCKKYVDFFIIDINKVIIQTRKCLFFP